MKTIKVYESTAEQQAPKTAPVTQQAGYAEVIECGNSYAKVKLKGEAFGSTKVGDIFYTAPQPAPAPLSDDVVKDAARYRWLIDQHWIQTEVDWRLISTHQDSTIRQLDAAIDAALAAQGGSDA